MYHKSNDREYRKVILETSNLPESKRASECKKIGRKVKLRTNWNYIKDDIMKRALEIKFSKEPMKTMLLNTGNLYLEETNTWNDRYWGVCNGIGKNRLGLLLMKQRERLKNEIRN